MNMIERLEPRRLFATHVIEGGVPHTEAHDHHEYRATIHLPDFNPALGTITDITLTVRQDAAVRIQQRMQSAWDALATINADVDGPGFDVRTTDQMRYGFDGSEPVGTYYFGPEAASVTAKIDPAAFAQGGAVGTDTFAVDVSQHGTVLYTGSGSVSFRSDMDVAVEVECVVIYTPHAQPAPVPSNVTHRVAPIRNGYRNTVAWSFPEPATFRVEQSSDGGQTWKLVTRTANRAVQFNSKTVPLVRVAVVAPDGRVGPWAYPQ
jgi:hypothetical protein